MNSPKKLENLAFDGTAKIPQAAATYAVLILRLITPNSVQSLFLSSVTLNLFQGLVALSVTLNLFQGPVALPITLNLFQGPVLDSPDAETSSA